MIYCEVLSGAVTLACMFVPGSPACIAASLYAAYAIGQAVAASQAAHMLDQHASDAENFAAAHRNHISQLTNQGQFPDESRWVNRGNDARQLAPVTTDAHITTTEVSILNCIGFGPSGQE